MRVGVSGHQRLPRQAAAYAEDAIVQLLKGERDLVGVCALAAGADQLFADLVLRMGGSLHVVIPCRDYEASFPSPCDVERFRELVSRAEEVEFLDHATPTGQAFLEAGRRVVDRSQTLIAIWDGKPARGIGGTADIVGYARLRGVKLHVLWPSGVVR